MSQSIHRKVGIASLIMMLSVFLSRVIGLLREMVIAYIGGAGGEVDAYQVAFVIPEILNHIVASGFLSVTFIPIFSRYLSQDREADGWRIFSIIYTVFGSLLLLLIIIAVFLAPSLVKLLAPGLVDPVKFQMAVRMTRIIIPAQFFFFSGGIYMAVQFAKEKFAIPALAPLLYNMGIIAGGALLGPKLGMEGFAWGVLGGAFIGNFAVQYFGARQIGMQFSPTFTFRNPDLIRYIKLTLPLIVGLTMMFSTEIFLKFFGSFLPPGSIAGLNYGLRVMLMMVGLFGQAIGVAATPFLSRLAVENRLDEMNTLLNTTLRYLGLVIPFSVLFIVLREEVVTILFQRGQFDSTATALTARVLLFLMTGAFAFAAQTVVVRGYYAMQNTLLPTALCSFAVLLSVPLYIIGMNLMGVSGIALAISVSSILQVTLLYAFWNRRSGNTKSGKVYLFYGRMFILAAILGGILEPLKNLIRLQLAENTFFNSLITCLIVGTLFLFCVIVIARRFNIPEITDTINQLKARIHRSYPPIPPDR
ncbi:MAG: murein biosynthesis integral membrane protein MurJ [Desulfobacterales bacterium]